MKERPIIFNAEMVRAIMAGRKTQTRRVIKPQPFHIDRKEGTVWKYAGAGHPYIGGPKVKEIKCPYGHPGDRLWVRETCKRFTGIPLAGCPWPVAEWMIPPNGDPYKSLLHVEGNSENIELLDGAAACVTVPSIFMPRWASRINLEVTGVRVERVQDISELDARAEGCSGKMLCVGDSNFRPGHTDETDREAFINLWNSINAKRGYDWDSNPWVWVIEFKQIAPPKSPPYQPKESE